MKLLVDPRKELLEEFGARVDTHEVICGASNYPNFFVRLCLKDVERMVNNTVDKS